MDRRDVLLVRLGDADLRRDLFDQAALQQIASAAYDVPLPPAYGSYEAVFNEVRLGVHIDRLATLDGWWAGDGDQRTQTRLRLTGGGALPRIDAIWTGAIRATVSAGLDRVDDVTAAQSTAVGDTHHRTLRVRYHAGAPGQPRPISLPLTAALFVAGPVPSLAGLLWDSRGAVATLTASGAQPAPVPELPARSPIVPVWIMPAEIFDDDGWPMDRPASSAADKRSARRAYAGRWLSAQGIGLAVPPD